jgi:hypothetical protein
LSENTEPIPNDILVDHAIWIGDYNEAFLLLSKLVNNTRDNESPSLRSYKNLFELAIVSKAVKKEAVMKECLNTLEKRLLYAKEITDKKRSNYISNDRNIREEELRIVNYFVKQKTFDFKKADHFVKSLDIQDNLALFISPNYSKRMLHAGLRRAEGLNAPELNEVGIFKFSIKSDFARFTCRAYSKIGLRIDQLENSEKLVILKKSNTSIQVEHEELRILSQIQADGLVVAYYLLENFEDGKALDSFRQFLAFLSDLLKPTLDQK